MEQLIDRCAGLDVHKRTIAACVRVPGHGKERVQHVQTFGTTAADLLTLRDWLRAHGVTHVALESTGVFWKPIYYTLEDGFTVVLVNAAHIQQVPGRKTDVQDSVWIAQLLEHGLVRASFVPPAPIRALRDLTRYRTVMIEERVREVNRIHKVLEEAGIKLAAVASKLLGASGRAMLDALVAGTTDPAVLADLARGVLRKKLPALRAALAAELRPHQAFLLGELLAHLDYLEQAITRVSAQIAEALAPFMTAVARLETIPGIRRRAAEVIVAEIGVDMTRFPTAGHLASWAGLCPGHHESAGRSTSGKPRKGNRWLKRTLTQTALGAIQSKPPNALGARYRRLRHHTGHKKAVVAVSHAQLVAAYHMLAAQQDYVDLGADYLDRHTADRARRRAIRTLERQGYHVTLETAA